MTDRRPLSLAIDRMPLHQMVFAVCIAAWALRVAYLSVPVPLSSDEVLALNASDYGTASRFVGASDWALRWVMVERISLGGRILWIFGHLIWGYAFPSNGQMAYLLTYTSALIATLALAGAARHLYGERGFLLSLLVTSLSPLFLNYTLRALGTMPSVMWICLGLFCLTSPRSTMMSWVGGGLCIGLAFGTHYGTGVAILAIACGLAVSVGRGLVEKNLPRNARVWRWAIAPVIGVVAAATPLVTLQLWALHAGSSYTRRLFQHENLGSAEAGPYGLWLRELFELDPLLQVIMLVAMMYTFRSTSLSRIQKTQLGIAYVLMFGLLTTSVDQASPRAFVSLVFFALVGLAVFLTRILERDSLKPPGKNDQIPETPAVRAPFDCRSLIPSIVVLVAIFTLWRPGSNMPRLVFPGWPLFVLGLVGLMLRLLPDSYHATIRVTVLLGSLLFLIGAGAAYHAKSAHSRARAYALEHPNLKHLTYDAFLSTTQAAARLSMRSSYDVVVLGPPARLHPTSCYEEEPWKIFRLRRMLKDFNLENVVTAEEIPYAYIFFEEAR